MRSCWPSERVLLLADTGLAGPERAKAAWAEWRAQSDLDAIPWFEVRALATAADRIAELTPDYPQLGRLKGFRRFIFINGQRTFSIVRPMLVALLDARIDVMLLKGVARIANDSSVAATRFVGDVDVLVRPNRIERAWQVARDRNWHMWRKLGPLTGGTWQGQAAASHALDFSPSAEVNRTILDLHHFSRSLCRNIGDDDGIWEHATPGRFMGLDLTLPSPTDHLRHTLTHALMHSSRGRPIDWVFDAADMMQSETIDWQRLAADTLASNTQGMVGAAMLLLKERLGLGVPDRVLNAFLHAFTPSLEGEFAFRTSSYFGDLKRPELIGDLVAAATARADTAAHRLTGGRVKPLQPSDWTEKLAPGPAVIAPRTMPVFPIPNGLRTGEMVQLKITFTSRAQDGQLSVHLPMMPIDIWASGPLADGEQVVRRLMISANLLLMTRSKLIGMRWGGKQPLEQVTVKWLRGPRALSAATRLKHAQAASRLA